MDEIQQKIKIIIADQQTLFRQGVRSIFSEAGDIEISDEVDSGQKLLSKMSNLCPDVVLLDINLPFMENQDLARSVKQQFPSAAIVLLTPRPNDDELFQAIKSRASGYISRNVSADELIANIRRAARGEHPINDTLITHPKAADKVLQQFQDFSWGKGVEAFVSPLTPRETEILAYIAKGYLNKQIASMLSISEQTIKNHVTSILRKLDANARTQAVITAVKMGLISLG
jgi:DNA-binding NarL/FixJ family response regulator